MRFVDTSYWVALTVPRDANHDSARALWESHDSLLTTNHVVGETWTFLRRRGGHRNALSFVHAVRSSPRVAIEHVDEGAEQDAWRWLRRHDEREYSFVDATSFAVMRRARVLDALAFDGGFAAAGFTELRP